MSEEKQVSGGARYSNEAVSKRLSAAKNYKPSGGDSGGGKNIGVAVASAADPELAAGAAVAKSAQPKKEAPRPEPEPEPEEQSVTGGPPPIASSGSAPSWAIPDSIVFLTGLGLIIVSAGTSGQLSQLGNEIWNGKSNLTRSDFIVLGGEFLFVALASFLAKVNGDIGNLVFTLFVALWLVWAINNQSLLVKWRDILLQSQAKK